jgi:AcrR family transcriptional regulator
MNPASGHVDGARHLDRRKQRTRQAALAAFSGLLFEQGYEALTLSAVADRAGIGRSTLYEHYRSKDDLLAASVGGPLRVLTVRHPDPLEVQAFLKHVREQGGKVRLLLAQPLRSRIAQVLAVSICARLRSEGSPPALAELRAIARAEAMLAAIAHWLRGGCILPAEAVAAALASLAEAIP